jgi:hypothetical protein
MNEQMRVGASAEREEPQERSDRRRIHVDTSLQIEQFKEEQRARPVRLALRQFAFTSTSSYARKEFKAAWLRDLAFLYEVARKAARIEDVLREVNSRLGVPVLKRRLQRCHEAIVQFLSRQSGSLPFEMLVLRYRVHLKEAILGAYMEWDRSVDHEFAGTQCVRAMERPKIDSSGNIDVVVKHCKREKIECRVHEFFDEYRPLFLRLAAAIDARCPPGTKDIPYALKELAQARDTIRSAERDPEHLTNISACSKIGDAIIAIDGIHADCFAANNPKEWRIIAETLGKELVNPLADPRPEGPPEA